MKMYEHYWVIDEFGDTVGNAWLDAKRCRYVVAVASLGKELIFADVDEMYNYLWGLGLDAM